MPKVTAEDKSTLQRFVTVLAGQTDKQARVMDTKKRKPNVPRPTPRSGRPDTPAARVDLATFSRQHAHRQGGPEPELPPGRGHARGGHPRLRRRGRGPHLTPFWLAKLTSDVRYSDDTDPDKFRFGYCVAELVWANPGAQPDPAGMRYYIAPQPRTMALSRTNVGDDDEFVAFESLAVSPPQPCDFTRTFPHALARGERPALRRGHRAAARRRGGQQPGVPEARREGWAQRRSGGWLRALVP